MDHKKSGQERHSITMREKENKEECASEGDGNHDWCEWKQTQKMNFFNV